MKFYKYLTLVAGVFFLIAFNDISTTVTYAQSSVQEELSSRNLSLQQARELARQAGLNPDNPVELARFARANGVSQEQIDIWLEELGVGSQRDVQPSGEVLDLRDVSVTSSDIVEIDPLATYQQVSNSDGPKKKDGLPYFGYGIFRNVPDAFRPTSIGAVDDAYVVGPEDELRLSVWGATEFQYELGVDVEGRIFIPNIGQITVAGQTVKELREYLKLRLSKSYSGLTKTPATIFMDVAMTRIRPIRIYVLGELENPGGYTFSSYSTVFNVLYGIGGPSVNGSLRDIRVIRNGKVISSFDLYDFLLSGEEEGSIRLQNNDRIFIPRRKNEIHIDGPVNRPGIYELQENEGLNDLIEYAGGLKAVAYGKRFSVRRIVPIGERTEPSIARKVLDYNLQMVLSGDQTYVPENQDRIMILGISDMLQNVANIDGAVFQPGEYELTDDIITVRDLILAADSLKGNAYLAKAELIRTNSDYSKSFISLDIEEVLNDVPQQNIVLKAMDKLKIYSNAEIESEYSVSLVGAVSNPETYEWRLNMTIYDLLFKGNGLFDTEQRERIFMKRADLIRRNEDGRSTIVIPFVLSEALENKGYGKEVLQPFDRVRIYSNNVELISDKFVDITGSVKNPGRFDYSKGMTLGDLLLQSGGFTEPAFLGEVEISRLENNEDDNVKTIHIFEPLLDDTTSKMVFYEPELLNQILRKADSIKLNHRDKIFIRRNPMFDAQETVFIDGQVKYPGTYTLKYKDEHLSSIIERAGGLTKESYSKGARLLRNNQQVIIELDEIISNNRNADILLQEGDRITVPLKPSTVLVTGNVALDGYIKYSQGKKLTYYLDRAGGLQKNSYKYLELTQANGAVYQIKRKGLFKDNPVVDDGARIRVIYEEPTPPRDKPSLREVFVDTTTLLTSALTLVFLFDRIAN